MKKIDVVLLATVVLLTLFGFFMIYDASSFVAFRDFTDKYHYVKQQFMWVILGFAGLFGFSLFNYKKLYSLALPGILIVLVLLCMVFIPGIGVRLLGGGRWIHVGNFALQPAEFMKLALAIYLAAWCSRKERGRFLAFLLLLILILVLVILEPDMGTAAVILSEAVGIYFLSGSSIVEFAYLFPVIFGAGFFAIKLAPYRLKRLESFLNLSDSIQSSSYHTRQILIALGSGGIFGVGLGNSLQKFAYLPETTTDSIFAIIAEELGFVGAIFLIAMFVLILWRGFSIALKTKDNFGRLLAGGITTFLGVQTLINLASQTALLPLTGIPLPFISYGGSALIVDLCSIGILLNISKNTS